MKEVTITAISRQERQKKDGSGTFESVGIKTKEYGDQFLNGFGNQYNKNWKEGDKVNIEVEEVVKGDRKYLNFKTAPKDSKTALELKMKLDGIKDLVKDTNEKVTKIFEMFGKQEAKRIDTEQRGYEYPENTSEEVPFEDKENDIDPEEIDF